MEVSCPSCNARYRVAQDAVPTEGRAIACAQCGASWHQSRVELPETLFDPEPLGAGIPDMGGIDMGAMNAGMTVFGPAAEAAPTAGESAEPEPARGGGIGTIGWLLILVLLGVAAAVGYGVYSGQLSLG